MHTVKEITKASTEKNVKTKLNEYTSNKFAKFRVFTITKPAIKIADRIKKYNRSFCNNFKYF